MTKGKMVVYWPTYKLSEIYHSNGGMISTSITIYGMICCNMLEGVFECYPWVSCFYLFIIIIILFSFNLLKAVRSCWIKGHEYFNNEL